MGSFLQDIFGKKPKVPELPRVDLDEEQKKAVQANIAIAPEAAKLSNLTADQVDALIRRSIPNWDKMVATTTSNIEDWSHGRIPTDVSDAVERSDAAKAFAGGYSGTGMHSALTARDLGLTSFNIMEKGLGAAESWLAATERLYSPATATFTNMFITPEQQFSADVEERNSQFERSWLKNQIAAMPDPVMRGIHDTIMSLAVAYLGGNYTQYNPQQSYSTAGRGVTSSGRYDGGWGGWNGEGTPPPAYGGYDAQSMGGMSGGAYDGAGAGGFDASSAGAAGASFGGF